MHSGMGICMGGMKNRTCMHGSLVSELDEKQAGGDIDGTSERNG